MDRQKREKLGHRAEFLAAIYLRLKGYQILSQRYKTKLGEIDIVARKKDILVVVEVKARESLGVARESITYGAQQRIARAADIYIGQNRHAQNLGLRFDALFVIGGWRLVHEQGAW